MRTRIFQIVQIAQKDDRASHLYDIFLVAVAFASIIPLMFHVDRLPGAWQFAFTALDFVTVYILFFDYLLRWITHDIKEDRRGDWKAFVKYPFTATALIDLAAILPSLGVLPASFMFLRALRVVRIMRYSRRLAVIVNTFASERRTLTLSLVLVGLYVFMVALLMFCNEPNTFDTFIDALYWAAVTLTTIGYGDLTPTTETGKVIVIAASIVGILVIALPAGIITGSFLDQLRQIGEDRERYFEANSFAHMHALRGFKATPASIRVYFQKNPRVGKYLVYMRHSPYSIAPCMARCRFWVFPYGSTPQARRLRHSRSNPRRASLSASSTASFWRSSTETQAICCFMANAPWWFLSTVFSYAHGEQSSERFARRYAPCSSSRFFSRRFRSPLATCSPTE